MTRSRSGFSLIEVIVALSVLALAMAALGKATAAVALRGRDNDVYAKRSSALQVEANKFGSASFANLSTWSTADKTFTIGDFTYTRKLTITATTSTHYTIKIVIVPSQSGVAKDSVIIDRTSPPSTTALCTGC